MKIEKICRQCGQGFCVPQWRSKAMYCSRDCSDKSKLAPKNCICKQCGVKFHMKPFQMRNNKRSLGFFCSVPCLAEAKRVEYVGDKNPNYKERKLTQDGYMIWHKTSHRTFGIEEEKLHRAVCCHQLGIKRIYKAHVHHRDCNILNNETKNLAIMTPSDHKWIHKCFGNATLWAFMSGKISCDEICSWSTDPERAKRLLNECVENGFDKDLFEIQDGILILKSGEK